MFSIGAQTHRWKQRFTTQCSCQLTRADKEFMLPADLAHHAPCPNRAAVESREHEQWERRNEELASLIEDVATARSERSFARLYAMTNGRLFFIVCRLVTHRGQAEEVMQDVYVKVWSRSAQFNALRGNAMQWLSGVARTTALDALRSLACRPRETWTFDDDSQTYSTAMCPAATPEGRYAAKQQAVQMLERVRALPAANRECVLLTYAADLNNQEIATVLGCPLATVKSRVRRGLLALKAKMP